MSLALYGITIHRGELQFKTLTIHADTAFNGKILVSNTQGQAIPGATITYSANIPLVGYSGSLTATTDSNGETTITGATTVNNTFTIEASGYNTYSGTLNPSFGDSHTFVLTNPSSKKLYVTNKGNTLINPNDTILIELD